MTDAQHLARAAQAKDALENPLIAEALDAWDKEITEAWKNSPLRDAEGREKLRLMLEASKTFKAHLTKTMETGKLIRARQPSLADRIKVAVRGQT